MKKYKALIFDMDGTLLDTIPGIITACNKTFEHFGYDISFTPDDGKHFIGAGAVEFAKRALARANVDIPLKDYGETFLKNYSVYQQIGSYPFKGLDDLLIKLKNAGYFVGVCSNKPQHLLNEVVLKMFTNIKFDAVMGQQNGIPCKPAPDMLDMIVKENNLNKKDILYIGDSEYDYKFASNSEVDSLIVTYGYGLYEDEFMKHVTYHADSVEELEKMLLQ